MRAARRLEDVRTLSLVVKDPLAEHTRCHHDSVTGAETASSAAAGRTRRAHSFTGAEKSCIEAARARVAQPNTDLGQGQDWFNTCIPLAASANAPTACAVGTNQAVAGPAVAPRSPSASWLKKHDKQSQLTSRERGAGRDFAVRQMTLPAQEVLSSPLHGVG